MLAKNLPTVLYLECGLLRTVLYDVNIASSSKKIYLVVPLQLLYHLDFIKMKTLNNNTTSCLILSQVICFIMNEYL